MSNLIKSNIITLSIIVLSTGTLNAAPISSTLMISNKTVFNIFLAIAIILLLIIIAIIGNIQSIVKNDKFKERVSKNYKNKTLSIILIYASYSSFFSQTIENKNIEQDMPSLWIWIMISIVLFFLVIIYYLKNLLQNLIKTSLSHEEIQKSGLQSKKLMKVLTNAVDIDKENTIMTDHTYDGIYELDNSLPPWWVWMFYGTIIFSVVYVGYYHFSSQGVLQEEAYNMEVEQANKLIAEYKKNNPSLIDVSNVKLLTDEKDINLGKEIFMSKCAVCHGKAGEGVVGPNLTDEYWLYGNKVTEIFNTMTEGTKNGMQSFKTQINGEDRQRLTSYILSLQGTNPANPKAPDGEKVFAESSNIKTEGKVVEIALLTADADIKAGKEIFDSKCKVCHGVNLQGVVGPNLVDDSYIYGGKVNDLIKVISDGTSKGMQAWKRDLDENKILQTVSYIKSKLGSNPAGAKAPEGTK